MTVDELVDAEWCWVKYEQTLMSSESETFEKLKRSLNLLRIDRCLKFNFNSVNTILLQKEFYFTKLVALRSHENVFHRGFE